MGGKNHSRHGNSFILINQSKKQTKMEKQLTLREQLENFNSGKYDMPNRDTQIEAGWFDWFCKDSSLAGKTEKLYRYVLQIAKSKKFDIDKVYVFFKNNCPVNGSLYDDFRICDIESGDVIFTVTPSRKLPTRKYKSQKSIGEIWGRENNFKDAIFEGNWSEIKKWFYQ